MFKDQSNGLVGKNKKENVNSKKNVKIIHLIFQTEFINRTLSYE